LGFLFLALALLANEHTSGEWVGISIRIGIGCEQWRDPVIWFSGPLLRGILRELIAFL